jgi:electron transfer flavoprotein beta subunit
MPVLLTAVKELNEPRYMSVRGIMEAYEKPVTVWSVHDVPVDPTQVGLDASPDKVNRSFAPEPKGAGTVFTGSPKELAAQLVDALGAKHII